MAVREPLLCECDKGKRRLLRAQQASRRELSVRLPKYRTVATPLVIFYDVTVYLRRERRNEFHLDETLLVRLPTLYESWN
jgi:hypothetical protein